ncbi:LysR family transcriptional regulator [Granulosicoccus antarcticus]|uniref:HTH-type transcriptional regulator YofA n=1 Tax=Granulosicoccus antarcticus IMCC3135 TaxID=1192854 RepID=A0A2Z2NGX6_9GAMM|nr:LysR family transcriptional regulator [Granulosicoccus antarcticus]ASJ70546.1 HTH-type transcriptional regulator YofA [Granulosicoccus antarcticus IMCC3135]
MNLKIAQLEAFVWVADLGSFRKAAERLNTTQPNISTRISGLEKLLDVTLMERDAGSVRLTSKGIELLEYARQVLRGAEKFMEASGQAALYEGVLKLGVTELVVSTWLRDFMKLLKRNYPNILVELTVDLSANLTEELFSRSIDLALQSGPFERQTSGAEKLGTYRWIWVASPELDDLQDDPLSIGQLLQYPVLTHARDTRPFEEIAAHFRSRRASTARLMPSSNLAACLHMAIDGMGTAAMPAAMVHDAIKAGQLRQIYYPWVPDSLVFLARYDALRSPAFVGAAAALARDLAMEHVAREDKKT